MHLSYCPLGRRKEFSISNVFDSFSAIQDVYSETLFRIVQRGILLFEIPLFRPLTLNEKKERNPRKKSATNTIGCWPEEITVFGKW